MTCPYDTDGDGDCHLCRLEGYTCGGDLPRPELAERLGRALDIPPELLESPVSNHWSARDPFAGSALADFMEPFVGEVTYGCRTIVAHWDGEHWVAEDVDPPSNL